MKGIRQTKMGYCILSVSVYIFFLCTSGSGLNFLIGCFREILHSLLGYSAFISLLLIVLNHEINISCASLDMVHRGVYLKIYLQPSCSEGNENLISICYASIKLYLNTISFLTWVLSWSAKTRLMQLCATFWQLLPFICLGGSKNSEIQQHFYMKSFQLP